PDSWLSIALRTAARPIPKNRRRSPAPAATVCHFPAAALHRLPQSPGRASCIAPTRQHSPARERYLEMCMSSVLQWQSCSSSFHGCAACVQRAEARLPFDGAAVERELEIRSTDSKGLHENRLYEPVVSARSLSRRSLAGRACGGSRRRAGGAAGLGVLVTTWLETDAKYSRSHLKTTCLRWLLRTVRICQRQRS